MQKLILFLVCIFLMKVNAGPLNLFVNVTMDDRPNVVFADGDIAVDRRKISQDGNIRNAYTRAPKWTNGILPYVIDPSAPYTTAQKNTIVNSMRTIESLTGNCIKFVERSTETAWLRIFSGSG